MTENLIYVRYRRMAGKKRGIVVAMAHNIESFTKLGTAATEDTQDTTIDKEDAADAQQTASPAVQKGDGSAATSEFEAVYNAFWDNLGRLIKATPEAQTAMGLGAQALNFSSIEGYLQSKGTRVGRKRSNYGCFAINSHDVRSLHDMLDAHVAQAALINGLPRLLVPTIVAHYDAFVSKLILLCLRLKPDVARTIQKDIKMSDLVAFATIEEAVQSLIDREVESIMRSSHTDQLNWISEKFKVKAEPEAELKKAFVELTERRNVIIHNDGKANSVYLRNCTRAGVDVSNITPGQDLTCNGEYLQSALACTLEMATKLHQVFWRQLAPKEISLADSRINSLTYELIVNKKYKAAEPIFDFCRKDIKQWSSEELRLMNVVNHANTLRFRRKNKDAKALLGKEDWATKTPVFQICVAAVEEDDEKAITLLKKFGKVMNITSADYMHWPVFRKLTKSDKFLKAYHETFGEDLLHKPKAAHTDESSAQNVESESSEPAKG